MSPYPPSADQRWPAEYIRLKQRLDVVEQQLNAVVSVPIGAWTDYSPSIVWSSSGTAPSIGNGRLLGAYSKIGRQVTARFGIYAGSTTTYGSGFYTLSLPFPAAVGSIPAGSFAHAGEWLIQNAGTGTFYTASAMILQSAPTVVCGLVNGNGAFMGAANPTTLSGAGQLVGQITFETAT